MPAANDWTKAPWYWVLAAVIGSTGLNQGLQLSFPMRKDAFTRNMAESMKWEMEQVWEDKLDEHKDRLILEMVEIGSAHSGRVESELKLYMRENFLPVTTPIPPPHVANSLELAHNRIDRLETRQEGQQERLTECCSMMPRSEIQSTLPVVPSIVLRNGPIRRAADTEPTSQ